MKFIKIKPEGGCGICGYIWQVLRAIYHNPSKKYYIDFETCIYKDSSVSENNVWNYYFKQPHVDVSPDPTEIEKTVGIIDEEVSEFRFNYLKNPTLEVIRDIRLKYNDIIKKYIVLQPDLQKKIDNYVEENFKGKKVLGLHLRGTDHPDKKTMKEYMPIIKNNLKNYDYLYVSSDEEYRYKFVKAVFGEKVITYNSIKSIDDKPLHHSKREPNYQYKIGEDVIIESYLLSKTDFLLCFSNSNVNFLSRCLSPDLEFLAL